MQLIGYNFNVTDIANARGQSAMLKDKMPHKRQQWGMKMLLGDISVTC